MMFNLKKILRTIALLLALAVVAGVIGFTGFGLPLFGLPLVIGLIIVGSFAVSSLALLVSSYFIKKPAKADDLGLLINNNRQVFQEQVNAHQEQVAANAQKFWPTRWIAQIGTSFMGWWYGIAKKAAALRNNPVVSTLAVRPLETNPPKKVNSPLYAHNWKEKGQSVVDALVDNTGNEAAQYSITINSRGRQDRLALRDFFAVIKTVINKHSERSSLPASELDFSTLNAWMRKVSKAISLRYHPDKTGNDPAAEAILAEFNPILEILKHHIENRNNAATLLAPNQSATLNRFIFLTDVQGFNYNETERAKRAKQAADIDERLRAEAKAAGEEITKIREQRAASKAAFDKEMDESRKASEERIKAFEEQKKAFEAQKKASAEREKAAEEQRKSILENIKKIQDIDKLRTLIKQAEGSYVSYIILITLREQLAAVKKDHERDINAEQKNIEDITGTKQHQAEVEVEVAVEVEVEVDEVSPTAQTTNEESAQEPVDTSSHSFFLANTNSNTPPNTPKDEPGVQSTFPTSDLQLELACNWK